jgi:hypothetical protein
MGATWFTSTSHSYCLTEGEYNEIRSASWSLTDSTFITIPDTELSSEEEGPQMGSDLANINCPNGVNHMGAHGIRTHKPGGEDGLLEFCNDPLYGFLSNIAAVNGEGGIVIIAHPAAASFGWNSFEATHGIQENGAWGVEIWNGPTRVGQGDHVAWWVAQLLRGEKMYAYSGSDTHDDVFDFGWTHAYVVGPFNKTNLGRALKAGRLYISNYQFLALVARTETEPWRVMGEELPVALPGPEMVKLAVRYDFGARSGKVIIFEGHAGDSEETVLKEETGLTGAGWLVVHDTAHTTGLSYYRAYSETAGSDQFAAYTNPIWITPLVAE